MNPLVRKLKAAVLILLTLSVPTHVLAQLPIDCNIFYLHNPPQIINYDPVTSTSSPNTIVCPAGSFGLAVSNNINSASPALTFYTIVGGQYWYYNGSSWTNTGHNIADPNALNLCGAGPYIYNFVSSTKSVYRYDGSGNDVLVMTDPSWTGGPLDLIGDDYGNFYLMYTNVGAKKLVKYSPTGVALCTYTLVGMPNEIGGAGYAIVNNNVYIKGLSGNWRGTITGNTITITSTTAYPVCSDFASCPFPQLTSSISSAGNLTCAGPSSVTLTATTTVTGPAYSWSGPGIVSGSTSNVAVINAPGIYTLVVTGTSGACPGASTSTIAISQTGSGPVVSSATAGSVTCASNTVNLSVSPSGMSYTWTPPVSGSIISGANSQNATGAGGGTYTVVVRDPVGGCSSSTTVVVPDNRTNPTVTVNPPAILTCNILTVSINSSSPNSLNYTWTGPGIVSGGNSSSPVINQPGNYTLTATDQLNGCPTSTIVNVIHDITPPTVSAASSNSITCSVATASVILTNTFSPVSYSWSGSGIVSGNTTPTITVNQGGTYHYTVTNLNNGCTASGSQTVIQNNTAVTASSAATNTITCITSTANIVVSATGPSLSYNWSGAGILSGNGTATITVNQSGTYNYTLTNTSNGCLTTGSHTVIQNTTPPSVTTTVSGTLTCVNTTATIIASPSPAGYTYNWSPLGTMPGNTSGTLTVNQPGTYNYTVTDASNGCSSSGSETVNQDFTAPALSLASSSYTTTCANPTATLIATATPSTNVSFAWLSPGTGALSDDTIANPIATGSGIFTITVTNKTTGCSAAQGTVALIPDASIPTASLSAHSLSITCYNPTPTLTVTNSPASVSYSWSPVSGIVAGTETTANPSFSLAGTYSVSVTNILTGCINNSAANTVTVALNNTSPVISLNVATNQATITCTTASVTVIPTVTPAGNLTYTWTSSTGTGMVSSPNQAAATFTAPGIYTLSVTNTLTGCSSDPLSTAGTFTVYENTAAPAASLVPTSSNTIITCSQSLVSYSVNVTPANNSYHYFWMNSGNATPFATITLPGTYTVIVTNTVNGCTTPATVTIEGQTTPPQDVSAGSNTNIPCGSNSIFLNGTTTSGNVTYSWSGPSSNSILSGSNTATPSVQEPGTYTLTVTNSANGCSSTATVSITQNNVIAAFTANPVSGFSPLAVNFTNNSQGASSYSWDFGDGQGSTLQDPSHTFTTGVYTVMLTAYSGSCTSTATLTIIVERPSFIDIPNVFTPNNDNINDLFTINAYGIRDISLEIFNRWGQKLFEYQGVKAAWDGYAVNGEPVPDGTYFFFVKATGYDEKKIEKQGTVNLFR